MSWGDEAQNPSPEWTMSAALENVSRGNSELAEVTNLREAVEAWGRLDPAAQEAAVLTPERPVIIDGAQRDRFEGQGIAVLAERLTDRPG